MQTCNMNEDDFRVEDFKKLQHMLGALPHKKKCYWGLRNHYAPGGTDIESMKRLEVLGLVEKGRKYNNDFFYHATEKGCLKAGLNKKQTKEALSS